MNALKELEELDALDEWIEWIIARRSKAKHVGIVCPFCGCQGATPLKLEENEAPMEGAPPQKRKQNEVTMIACGVNHCQT